MKVKSRMSCPVRRKDGTWTTVIKEFEEDIPDLGREELICNKCGRPDYPKCKETVCEAWKYHESKTITHLRAEVKPWLLFLCKGENYACQRSDKSGHSGCS